MIPGFLKEEAEKKLSGHLQVPVVVSGSRPVSGGCINRCFELQTSSGKFFLKYNDAGRFPGMFEAEARGLALLADARSIPVPVVIATGAISGLSFLLLEWIESARRKKNFWTEFGSRLAKLHHGSAELFGLASDNYIGSLPQSNRQHKRWTDFFIGERIEPQIKRALDAGAMTHEDKKKFDRLADRMDELVPGEPPALLHGDLWSGNFMADSSGSALLMDPAVYYGHREADLAMTKLFGGFDPEFYEAYGSAFPLKAGFSERADIHNLYPLLVHVNLFGGGYIEQVRRILGMYS
jgi:protein-ribulosamine 3-kinase